MKKLRLLDLFSGIGGFSLGLERSGYFETVAFCEIEEFPRKVLAKHWPEIPCYPDVRTIQDDMEGFESAEAITAGFPCQDISFAGKGAGLAGERSGLWWQVRKTIRLVRPQIALLENVAALLNRGMGTVLGSLAKIGYDTEWHCIPASHVGLPHIRDRVWIIANDWQGRGQRVEPQAFQRLSRFPWSENVRSAQNWARRSDLFASWLCRAGDGISNRIHRTESLGNSVAHQIPELIGRAIGEYFTLNPQWRTGLATPISTGDK